MRILQNNIDVTCDAVDDAVQLALMAVGLQAENYARNNAPVDTGRLRNSITHVTEGKNKVIIGTNVEYAPYQELGTRKMQACNAGQGFLRPAINNHMDEYKSIVADIVAKAVT